VRQSLLAVLLALTLSACPAFGDEDPGGGESRCDLDPDACAGDYFDDPYDPTLDR
jgi:hypothetical protein